MLALHARACDLNPISTVKKKNTGMVVCLCDPNTGQVETESQASQSRLIGEVRSMRDPIAKEVSDIHSYDI